MAINPSFMGGSFGTSAPAPNPTSLINTGNIFLQVPNLQVTVRGRPVNATLLGATITYGMDIGISTATVEFTAANIGVGTAISFGSQTPPAVVVDPTHTLDGINYFDPVTIVAGGDPNNPTGNYNALRFTGLYIRTEATMWPSVFQMVCKGNLYRAEQYHPATGFEGLTGLLNSLAPFIGTPLMDYTFPPPNDTQTVPGYGNHLTLCVDTTDDNIVWSILAKVPGLNVDFNNIDGTHKVICASYWDTLWPPYRSAWEQVQEFDKAFLGFRTYESIAGNIFRSRTYGYPTGPADYQYTEGIDIWEAEGTRSIEDLINASYVEGMTKVSTLAITSGPTAFFAYIKQSNPFQLSADVNPCVEQFRTPFAENSLTVDPNRNVGNVLFCDEVANWRLAERNRELVHVTLTTYRDDVLGIGRVITVNSPHSAVTEPIWVQRVEIRVQAQPALFQQTIYGLGGGVASSTDTPNGDAGVLASSRYPGLPGGG